MPHQQLVRGGRGHYPGFLPPPRCCCAVLWLQINEPVAETVQVEAPRLSSWTAERRLQRLLYLETSIHGSKAAGLLLPLGHPVTEELVARRAST